MIKDQLITDEYALYHSDCMYVLPTMPDESIDLSIYSPPFAGLYNYSSSENDFSNCETKDQFLQQYEYLIKEIAGSKYMFFEWKSGDYTIRHMKPKYYVLKKD